MTDALNRAIGDRLRRARLGAGVGVDELASNLAVPSLLLHRFEDGKSQIPAALLFRAARLLGRPVAELIGAVPAAVAEDSASLSGARRLLDSYNRCSPEARATVRRIADELAELTIATAKVSVSRAPRRKSP